MENKQREMVQLLVFIKLLLFGLLFEESFCNIEEETSKQDKKSDEKVFIQNLHAWLFLQRWEDFYFAWKQISDSF